MKAAKVFLIVQLIIIALYLAGMVQCAYKAVNCDWSNETSWKAEIIYTGSFFTGFGGIVGWFDIEDK